MTTELDVRLRSLMVRLGEATPVAPPFESLADVEVVPTPRRRDGRSAIVFAALAVLVVAALAVVTMNRPSDDASGASVQLQQVATDLPDGWVLQGALGPGTHAPLASGLALRVFGTTAAPLGPSVAILTDGFTGLATDAQNIESLTLTDGRRAVLGDSWAGGRWLDVEIEPGRWVGLLARDIDDDALARLGAALDLDALGAAEIEPTQLVSEGLLDFGEVDLATMPYSFWGFVDPAVLPLGETLSVYGPEGGDAAASLATFTPTPAFRAVLAVLQIVEPIGDSSDVVARPNDASSIGVYRETDGLAMYASAPTADLDALVALLDSVEQATDDQWTGLVRLGEGRARAEQTNNTTESTDVPSPPVVTEVVDREFSFDPIVEPSDSLNAYRLSATLWNGAESVSVLTFRGRTLTASVSIDGAAGPTADLLIAYPSGGSSLSRAPDSGVALVLVAVGLDSEAVRISASAGGVAFTADLVQLDDSYPVKIGMLLVPIPVNGSSQMSDTVLLGPDGSALGTA